MIKFQFKIVFQKNKTNIQFKIWEIGHSTYDLNLDLIIMFATTKLQNSLNTGQKLTSPA